MAETGSCFWLSSETLDTSAWTFLLENQAGVAVELEMGGEGRSVMGPAESHPQSRGE